MTSSAVAYEKDLSAEIAAVSVRDAERAEQRYWLAQWCIASWLQAPRADARA